MGKRSNFERKPRDFYPTPEEAVIPLFNYLPVFHPFRFAEPCCGEGDLIRHLQNLSGVDQDDEPLADCRFANDISLGKDALTLTAKDVEHCDYIITNPPWSRPILHSLIEHFRKLRPTWLLMDAPWAFTKQSKEHLKYCSDIVVVGRVRWIPESKFTSLDDCCWYKFVDYETETIFHGR